MANDPVCGMQVDEEKAAATYEYKGKKYYFCAAGCRDKFFQDPEKFIKDEKNGTSPDGPWIRGKPWRLRYDGPGFWVPSCLSSGSLRLGAAKIVPLKPQPPITEMVKHF